MSELVECTTQAEVDAATAAGNIAVVRAGIVRASGTATVRASGTATVRASGTATVSAFGTATVWAYDSATVWAYDSATVSASDSATVRASDSATVWAYDAATVRASDAATVSASGTATVSAAKYVAVHQHSRHAAITGGHLIVVPDIATVDDWFDYHGVNATDGHVVLYKAVDDQLRSGRGMPYPLGEVVEALDWSPVDECGGGLHLCATAHHATAYFPSASRWLACRVAVADLVVITDGAGRSDKVKARRVEVLHEVDIHGRPVGEVA